MTPLEETILRYLSETTEVSTRDVVTEIREDYQVVRQKLLGLVRDEMATCRHVDTLKWLRTPAGTAALLEQQAHARI